MKGEKDGSDFLNVTIGCQGENKTTASLGSSVLDAEPRTFWALGKHSSTELQPYNGIVSVNRWFKIKEVKGKE